MLYIGHWICWDKGMGEWFCHFLFLQNTVKFRAWVINFIHTCMYVCMCNYIPKLEDSIDSGLTIRPWSNRPSGWQFVMRKPYDAMRSEPWALLHDGVIKWKHFLCYWPFVRKIHRSPLNSPHEGLWRETLIFSFICAWLNGSVKNGVAGDLRRHRIHYPSL